MADELADSWKESLKDALKNLSGFIKWLLVLNLTIALTYVVQYLQLKKQKEDVKKYDLVTGLPWNLLGTYYSNISGDSIAKYESNKIFPMLELGELSILGSTAMMDPIAKATPQEAKDAKEHLPELQLAFNSIKKYSSALTEISAVKRDGIHFEDLDQQHLSALIALWNFDPVAVSKEFNHALKAVIKNCEGYHKSKDSIRFIMIFASPDGGVTIPAASPKVLKELSFADSLRKNGFLTFNQQSVQVMADFEKFFAPNLTDSLRKIGKVLSADSSTFKSIGTFKDEEKRTETKIEEFESGSSVAIPLTNISISLLQFVTVAGIINLFILVYFLFQCKKAAKLYENYCKFTDHPADNMGSYFYNWTFGINNPVVFYISFGSCLSFCSLISLLFAILLSPICDNKMHTSNFLIIVPFTLVNFALGIIASKRFIELNKSDETPKSEPVK